MTSPASSSSSNPIQSPPSIPPDEENSSALGNRHARVVDSQSTSRTITELPAESKSLYEREVHVGGPAQSTAGEPAAVSQEQRRRSEDISEIQPARRDPAQSEAGEMVGVSQDQRGRNEDVSEIQPDQRNPPSTLRHRHPSTLPDQTSSQQLGSLVRATQEEANSANEAELKRRVSLALAGKLTPDALPGAADFAEFAMGILEPGALEKLRTKFVGGLTDTLSSVQDSLGAFFSTQGKAIADKLVLIILQPSYKHDSASGMASHKLCLPQVVSIWNPRDLSKVQLQIGFRHEISGSAGTLDNMTIPYLGFQVKNLFNTGVTVITGQEIALDFVLDFKALPKCPSPNNDVIDMESQSTIATSDSQASPLTSEHKLITNSHWRMEIGARHTRTGPTQTTAGMEGVMQAGYDVANMTRGQRMAVIGTKVFENIAAITTFIVGNKKTAGAASELSHLLAMLVNAGLDRMLNDIAPPAYRNNYVQSHLGPADVNPTPFFNVPSDTENDNNGFTINFYVRIQDNLDNRQGFGLRTQEDQNTRLAQLDSRLNVINVALADNSCKLDNAREALTGIRRVCESAHEKYQVIEETYNDVQNQTEKMEACDKRIKSLDTQIYNLRAQINAANNQEEGASVPDEKPRLEKALKAVEEQKVIISDEYKLAQEIFDKLQGKFSQDSEFTEIGAAYENAKLVLAKAEALPREAAKFINHLQTNQDKLESNRQELENDRNEIEANRQKMIAKGTIDGSPNPTELRQNADSGKWFDSAEDSKYNHAVNRHNRRLQKHHDQQQNKLKTL